MRAIIPYTLCSKVKFGILPNKEVKSIKDLIYCKWWVYYSKEISCWNPLLSLSDMMLSFCCSLFKSPNKIPWYTLIVIKNTSLRMYKCCSLSVSHSDWLILYDLEHTMHKHTALSWTLVYRSGPHLKVQPQPMGKHCSKFSTMQKPLREAGSQGHTAGLTLPGWQHFQGGGIIRDQEYCTLWLILKPHWAPEHLLQFHITNEELYNMPQAVPRTSLTLFLNLFLINTSKKNK